MWIVAVIFSAVFAGLTAILSKCGVRHANSDVATAVHVGRPCNGVGDSVYYGRIQHSA